MDAAEAGLASKAERFFVLVQTDNLWKEHLQAIKFLQQAVRWAGGRMGAAGAAVGWLRCDLPEVCLLAGWVVWIWWGPAMWGRRKASSGCCRLQPGSCSQSLCRRPSHPLPLPALPACSLRGYAQRDPLVEYKLEGYNLFVEMMAQVST